MNAFETCRNIEETSDKEVLKYLKDNYDLVVHTDSFNNNRLYQSYYGDYLVVKKSDKFFVEVKAEMKNKYNNFYLETWSNKPVNLGWFKKCKADIILYHFIEDNTIYMFDLLKAQEYINTTDKNYREKAQNKYSQKNKAFGLCVPIDDIMANAGITTLHLNQKEN